MKTVPATALSIALVLAAVGVSGCGKGKNEDEGDGNRNGSGGTGATPNLNFGGAGSLGAGTIIDGFGEVCAGVAHEAEVIPLAIHIMLDKSGSMLEKTGTGETKWRAITSALEAFLGDVGSSGIAVGLHFFPPNEPCTTDADCSSGWCHRKGCVAGDPPEVTPCRSDRDCSGCVELGTNGTATCTTLGSGGCERLTASVCTLPDICALARYTAPTVAIGTLPGSAGALLGALGEHYPAILPYGRTPMAPALEGAIGHASEFAAGNPGHKVIAVLATDGKPTLCNPQDTAGVAAIAAAGLDGRPSIETYTIGVFKTGDEGPETVDAIAKRGGGASFIVDNDGDVAGEFVEALNTIRELGAAPCEYSIPKAPNLDFNKVNIEWAEDDTSTLVPYVADTDGCSSEGGWHYDVADYHAQAPTKIHLCPSTCAEQGSPTKRLAIRIGCITVTDIY